MAIECSSSITHCHTNRTTLQAITWPFPKEPLQGSWPLHRHLLRRPYTDRPFETLPDIIWLFPLQADTESLSTSETRLYRTHTQPVVYGLYSANYSIIGYVRPTALQAITRQIKLQAIRRSFSNKSLHGSLDTTRSTPSQVITRLHHHYTATSFASLHGLYFYNPFLVYSPYTAVQQSIHDGQHYKPLHNSMAITRNFLYRPLHGHS